MNITFSISGTTYSVPFVFYDIENQDISGSAYEPTTATYLDHGFWVKPDTAGTLPVITLAAYKDNGSSFSGLSYVDMYIGQFEWLLTPVVRVNTGGDASNINVGLWS